MLNRQNNEANCVDSEKNWKFRFFEYKTKKQFIIRYKEKNILSFNDVASLDVRVSIDIIDIYLAQNNSAWAGRGTDKRDTTV